MSDSPVRFLELPHLFRRYVVALALVYLVTAFFALPHGRPIVIIGLIIIFAASCLVQPILSQYGGIRDPSGNLMILAALLWEPPEVLLGVGLGHLVGLPLFRRNETWRATTNAVGAALPACVMAGFAHWAKLHIKPNFLSLLVGSVVGYVVFRIINQAICALSRTLRFGRPFLSGWWQNVIAWWSSHLLPVPLIVVFVTLALNLGSITWGLVLTAAYLLVLPVPRWRCHSYDDSGDIADRVAEAIVASQRGIELDVREREENKRMLRPVARPRFRMGDFGFVHLGIASHGLHLDLRALIQGLHGGESCGAVPVSQHISNLAERPDRAARIEADILTTAEIYDSAKSGLSPFNEPVSPDEVIRQLMLLTGTAVDPDVSGALLRVAVEEERRATGGQKTAS